jgi:hypothetical protein
MLEPNIPLLNEYSCGNVLEIDGKRREESE